MSIDDEFDKVWGKYWHNNFSKPHWRVKKDRNEEPQTVTFNFEPNERTIKLQSQASVRRKVIMNALNEIAEDIEFEMIPNGQE